MQKDLSISFMARWIASCNDSLIRRLPTFSMFVKIGPEPVTRWSGGGIISFPDPTPLRGEGNGKSKMSFHVSSTEVASYTKSYNKPSSYRLPEKKTLEALIDLACVHRIFPVNCGLLHHV